MLGPCHVSTRASEPSLNDPRVLLGLLGRCCRHVCYLLDCQRSLEGLAAWQPGSRAVSVSERPAESPGTWAAVSMRRHEGSTEWADLARVPYRSSPIYILLLYTAVRACVNVCVGEGVLWPQVVGSGVPRPTAENRKTVLVCPAWRFGLSDLSPILYLADCVKASISEDRKLVHTESVWSLKATWRFTGKTRWNHPVSDCGTQVGPGIFEPMTELPFLFPAFPPPLLWYLFPPHKLEPLSLPGEKGALARTKSTPTPPPPRSLVIALQNVIYTTWH